MQHRSEVTGVLIKARDNISRGWCQGSYRESGYRMGSYKQHDRFCVIGALMEALGVDSLEYQPIPEDNRRDSNYLKACKFLNDALADRSSRLACPDSLAIDTGGYLIQFNDHHAEDRDDVVRLFNEAIAKSLNADLRSLEEVEKADAIY